MDNPNRPDPNGQRCPNGRTTCKGHKHFRGGSMDGHVDCLVYAHQSDYPKTFGTMKRDGQRSWYVRDYTATKETDTEAFYRFIGNGDTCPSIRRCLICRAESDELFDGCCRLCAFRPSFPDGAQP